MKQIYMTLLRLYPAGHRILFGAEMAAVFEEGLAGSRSFREVTRFIFMEWSGLVRGAAAAWIGRLRHLFRHQGRTACGCLPDFRMARPPWTDARTFYRLLKTPAKAR